MTKKHYISFIAAVSSDKLQMVKLYPEGNAEARFKIRGVRKILFYCNKDGLFGIDTVKGIDDRKADMITPRKDGNWNRQLRYCLGKLKNKNNAQGSYWRDYPKYVASNL